MFSFIGYVTNEVNDSHNNVINVLLTIDKAELMKSL
jgi:hypothetical protein